MKNYYYTLMISNKFRIEIHKPVLSSSKYHQKYLGLVLFVMILTLSSCASFFMNSVVTNYIDCDVYKNEISKYGLNDNDTLVDIGSFNGYFDAIISHYYTHLFFVLEDINKKFDKKINSLQEVDGEKNSFYSRSRMVIGTDEKIPLSSSTYKVVLSRLTVHEFKKTTKMIKELNRILVPGGELIIVDEIPKYKGEICSVCKMKLLSKDEIIDLFTANEFIFKTADTTTYSCKNYSKRGNLNILNFTKAY